MADRSRAAR